MTTSWAGTGTCPHCNTTGRCKVIARRGTNRRVRCCHCGEPYSIRDDGTTAKSLHDGIAGARGAQRQRILRRIEVLGAMCDELRAIQRTLRRELERTS